MRRTLSTVGIAALTLAAACADDSANVGLAFSTRSAATGVAAQAGDSTLVVRGNDTLIIRSVDIVLREIELKRLDQALNCPDSSRSDDACEEFTVGIQLVSLPLGNSTDKVLAVDVGPGLYDEVEFGIHKPDDITDAAFIAGHPLFSGVSIRVTGTFSQGGTRSVFTFITDLNEDQEILLNPPLDVTAAATVNLTIRLDVATWFLSAGGTGVVNPTTANNGGANQNLVRNNIEQSIDAFHDDDSDGLDDDTEDDDHGRSHDSP